MAFFYSLFIFHLGFNNPILDMHSFRQTSTAISVYWMLKEGHYLAYQTPVLGYPWQIPFEFPLYQWLVAFLYKLSSLSLDKAGRIINIVFFYLTLAPTYILLKKLNFKYQAFLIFSSLYLCSSTYLYWSRTFMIESLALFLSMSYLGYGYKFLIEHRKRITEIIIAIIFGSLASLTKATTFIPFASLLIVLFLLHYHKTYGFILKKSQILISVYLILILLIPFGLLQIWTSYVDHLKSMNELGKFITSKSLAAWNFGTLSQRFSYNFWSTTIFFRNTIKILGIGLMALYILITAIYIKRAEVKFALLFFLTFLSAYLIFPNLHIIHDYYDYENMIFVLLAAAMILNILWTSNHLLSFFVILFLSLTIEITTYHYFYKQAAVENTMLNRDYIIANFIKEHTYTDDFLLVYGNDWSPTISYYSQKKSLVDPLWGDYINRLQNINKFAGNLSLGAIVICPSKLDNDKKALKLLKRLTKDFQYEKIYDCKIYYKKL